MRKVWGLFIAVAACTSLAAAQEPPSQPLTGMNWERTPDSEHFARHYPRAAYRHGLPGSASIQCSIGATGDLENCAVISETPHGHGFGEAALRISRHFRVSRTTTDGRSTEGGSVTVPITFRIG